MIVHCGRLRKRGFTQLRWNERSFVLKPAVLVYFSTDADAEEHLQDPDAKKPKGSLSLLGATVVGAQSKRASEFAFTLRSGGDRPVRWTLAGHSAEETKQWVGALANLGVPNNMNIPDISATAADASSATQSSTDELSSLYIGSVLHSFAHAAQSLITREMVNILHYPTLSIILTIGTWWAWFRPGGAAWSELTPQHPPPRKLAAVVDVISSSLQTNCWSARRGEPDLLYPWAQGMGRVLQERSLLKKLASTMARPFRGCAICTPLILRLPRGWAEQEPIEFAFGILMGLLLVIDVGHALIRTILGFGLAALLPSVIFAYVTVWLPYWCMVAVGIHLPVRMQCFGILLLSPMACARALAALWCGALAFMAAMFNNTVSGAVFVVLAAILQVIRAVILATAAMLAWASVVRLAGNDSGAWFELQMHANSPDGGSLLERNGCSVTSKTSRTHELV